MQPLTISLVQSELAWEDKQANLQHFDSLLATVPQGAHVVVLPEMFTTGFSMNPAAFAEQMNGETLQWVAAKARLYKKIITGSLIIEEAGKYYNRLVWMQPDGHCFHYDKRHLFGYGGEDRHYTAGQKRLIVQANGWRICLQVCYDLRFPVWARQTIPENAEAEYDLLLYVANWPQRRSLAWKSLLLARAIENQCFVAGVNRIGNDGNGVYHSGDSALIGPLGETIWQEANEPHLFTHTLNPEILTDARKQFPFLRDADKFSLLY
ncbi:MAG: amidohydrolase [Edaphocola sp.]